MPVGLGVPSPVDVMWGEERPAQRFVTDWLHDVRFVEKRAREQSFLPDGPGGKSRQSNAPPEA